MCTIWWKMTEKENNLLAVFEERLRDLVKLCNEKEYRIKELEASLCEKNEMIQQAKLTIEALHTKNTNLLTAQGFALNEGAFQNARKRVNKLVREVDTCIALLNE